MTKRKAPSSCITADCAAEEPVLLVPPQLTQSAYALLVKHGLVPRKWHLEGRYGSRTFRPSDYSSPPTPTSQKRKVAKETPVSKDCGASEVVNIIDRRMGLPLLESAVVSGKLKMTTDADADEEMKTLLATPGVEIVRLRVPHPKNAPKPEHIDATIHPDRAPAKIPLYQRTHKPDVSHKSSAAPAFTFMELFSGIGGFGVALETLGGQCLFASEINKNCNQVYMNNMAHPPEGGVHGDIYRVPDDAFPAEGRCDLLVAGFPCQPFSRLGAQPGFEDGDRGMLYTQIVRALKVSRPKAFLLENVQGLADMGNSLKEILASLNEVGYDVTTEVVSSRGLTVQSRKRLFFVGIMRADVTDSAATSSKPAKSPQFSFPYIPDLALRARDAIEYDNECNAAVDEFDQYRLSATQMEQLLSRSKRWKPAKLAWPDTTLDVLDGHYGVTVSKGNSQLVPGSAPANPRVFTPRECARVMGFPNYFQIPNTTAREDVETRRTGHTNDTSRNDNDDNGQDIIAERSHRKRLYLMFGNAVCPPLIAVLAGAVLAEITESNDKEKRRNDWRSKGLEVAVSLSLEAVVETRRENIILRLAETSIFATCTSS